jgi:hypothetical protein
VFPTRGGRIERKASDEIHHGHRRRAIGFRHIATPIEKAPANQACCSGESDASNQDVSSAPRHSESACGGEGNKGFTERIAVVLVDRSASSSVVSTYPAPMTRFFKSGLG